MAAYSFLKEAKLYLVQGSQKYLIPVSSLSFSQTIAEDGYSVRTLHSDDYFEGSTITKANAANFEINTYLYQSGNTNILVDLAINCTTFDLYIQTLQDTFKVTGGVVTNLSIDTNRGSPLKFSVSGEAEKAERIADNLYSVPESLNSYSTQIPLLHSDNSIVFNSLDYSSDTISASVELQTDVEWLKNTTVHNTLSGSITYPSSFVLSKKILAGSIQRYITPDNGTDVQSHSTSVPVRIKVGQDIDGTFYGFDINMGSCSYTNRMSTGTVFTQNYDWRMTDNSVSLTQVINYNTQ